MSQFKFLLDEQLRGQLWQAIRHHNAAGVRPLDIERVGDPADLPCGSLDPDILVWAEWNRRLLVTLDQKTMPGHFRSHLAAGRHSPGVVILRSRNSGAAVRDLEMLAYAEDPAAWLDRIDHYP